MQKAYKADTPEHTIERIRTIIQRIGLPVREESLGDGDMFCSCRISITRDNDTSIGTNGKGMTTVFAKASGLAEFMERLQNRVIVYPNPASIGAACRFFPDELPYTWKHDEAVRNIRKFTPRVYPDCGLNADRVDGMSLPFYHVNSGEVRRVPYSLIRWINGSNGMAAGNIREEALVQGFNEIFERYCIQEMYRRGIVPPDVPMSEFEGTEILSRLRRMQREYGMDYAVKDYSLGEGFPVLGLMVYNKDHSKYIMHFGADLNPRIALERCFTEIFQGYTADTLRFENDVNSCERLDLFNEFKRSLMHGRGRLPASFFSSKPSYAYNGYCGIKIGRDFREDVTNICQWIMDKGYDIYLRDNSFLGFASLHIVIPGMSEIDSSFCDINRRVHHMQLTENNINPLFRLHRLSDAECHDTIKYIESIADKGVCLFSRNNNKNNRVNRRLLLMLLYIKVKDWTNAQKQLQLFFNENADDSRRRAVERAYEWLKDKPQEALQLIATPDCFDCDGCEVKDGCRYPLLREIECTIQREMAGFDFNQTVFAEMFIS